MIKLFASLGAFLPVKCEKAFRYHLMSWNKKMFSMTQRVEVDSWKMQVKTDNNCNLGAIGTRNSLHHHQRHLQQLTAQSQAFQ
jgi:hypothetical protein